MGFKLGDIIIDPAWAPGAAANEAVRQRRLGRPEVAAESRVLPAPANDRDADEAPSVED